MLIKPKKTKYTIVQKGKLKTFVSLRTSKINKFKNHGDYFLYSCETGFLIDKHLEAGKKSIKNFLGKKGLLWINVFPSKPVTRKPVGVRIGKGKGSVSSWIIPVFAGKILFELKNVSFIQAKNAFFLIQKKLPLLTRISLKKQPLYLFYN